MCPTSKVDVLRAAGGPCTPHPATCMDGDKELVCCTCRPTFSEVLGTLTRLRQKLGGHTLPLGRYQPQPSLLAQRERAQIQAAMGGSGTQAAPLSATTSSEEQKKVHRAGAVVGWHPCAVPGVSSCKLSSYCHELAAEQSRRFVYMRVTIHTACQHQGLQGWAEGVALPMSVQEACACGWYLRLKLWLAAPACYLCRSRFRPQRA